MDTKPTTANSGNEPVVTQHTLAKQRLASHPEAKPEVLEKLGGVKNDQLQARVAENTNTPAETLDKLSMNDSAEVRIAVAENSSTPAPTLESLACDENPDVRYRLAENPDTPVPILETLAQDENPYVVARAHDTLNAVQCVADRANDLMLQEHYSEAEELYRKLVTGLEELLGSAHPEVGRALHKLAAVVAIQHREDEAQALEVRANAIKITEGEIS